ncbi:MAG: hypothetical protein RLZZ546_2945, partial [Bacteroidota bacterium]
IEGNAMYVFNIRNELGFVNYDGKVCLNKGNCFDLGYCSNIKYFGSQLFFCTANGLFKSKGNNKIDTLAINNEEDEFNCIDVIEANNELWLLTTKGLFTLDNGQWLKVFSDNLNINHIAFSSSYKILFYSNESNITSIDLTCKKVFFKKPIVSLKMMKIDGLEKSIEKPFINLKYNVSSFEILVNRHQALSNELLKVYYKYPQEKNWHLANGNISISNLKPGIHSIFFKVKANNNLESEVYEFKYVVNSPFYLKWWFILSTLFTSFLIGALYNNFIAKQRLRMKQAEVDKLKALQDQKNQIAQDLHDEMGSGLSKIKHLVMSSNDGESKNLKQIEQLSSNLIQGMRDLLWTLDDNNSDLESLIAKSRNMARLLFHDTDIKFTVKNSCQAELNLSLVQRRQLMLIFKEAFTNILKHSKANEVIVSFKCDNSLEITILDNGIGFDPLKISQGYGLKSMKSRVLTLNGTLEIESKIQLTSVNIKIPITL